MELKASRLEALLDTPVTSRSASHIAEIERLVIVFDFFAKLHEDPDLVQLCTACCKQLKLVRCRRGAELYEYGNQAKALFGLISGEVRAKIPEVKGDIEPRRGPMYIPITGQLLSKLPAQLVKERTVFDFPKTTRRAQVEGSFGRILIVENHETWSPGCSFGSIERDKNYSETIEATEDCLLFSLSRRHYEQAVAMMEESRNQRVAKFLSCLTPIAGWTKSSYLKLAKQLDKRVLKTRSIVYKEGDAVDGVFLAQSGEFEFITRTRQLSLESPRAHTRETKVNMTVTTMQIYNTSAPDILGASDLLCKRTHQFTCRVFSSTAEVYWLSEEGFQENFMTEASLKHFIAREEIESEWIKTHSSKMRQVRDSMNMRSPINYPSVEATRSARKHSRLSTSFLTPRSTDLIDESYMQPILTPKHKLLTMSKLQLKQLKDSIKPSPSRIMLDVTSTSRPALHFNKFPLKRTTNILPCNFHATGESALNDKYAKYRDFKLQNIFPDEKARLAESIRLRRREQRSLMFTEN